VFVRGRPGNFDGAPRVEGDDREKASGEYHGPQAVREHLAFWSVLLARESDDRCCDRCRPWCAYTDTLSSEYRGTVDARRIKDDGRRHAGVDGRLEMPVHVGWANLNCATRDHERAGQIRSPRIHSWLVRQGDPLCYYQEIM
jgi:hypothetical protein